MTQITLTPEQTKTLSSSLEPVEIRDGHGRLLVVVPPIWTKEDIEEAKRRLADPNAKWYTFEEVMARIRSLEKE